MPGRRVAEGATSRGEADLDGGTHARLAYGDSKQRERVASAAQAATRWRQTAHPGGGEPRREGGAGEGKKQGVAGRVNESPTVGPHTQIDHATVNLGLRGGFDTPRGVFLLGGENTGLRWLVARLPEYPWS